MWSHSMHWWMQLRISPGRESISRWCYDRDYYFRNANAAGVDLRDFTSLEVLEISGTTVKGKLNSQSLESMRIEIVPGIEKRLDKVKAAAELFDELPKLKQLHLSMRRSSLLASFYLTTLKLLTDHSHAFHACYLEGLVKDANPRSYDCWSPQEPCTLKRICIHLSLCIHQYLSMHCCQSWTAFLQPIAGTPGSFEKERRNSKL